MSNILALILIVLVATTLQAGTGFGFAIMAIPFLVLLFPAHDAILLNIILSIIVTILVTYKIYNEVDKELLKRLIKGSLFGLLPGLMVFVYLDVKFLKIFVSILILISTALLMTKVKVEQSNTKEYIVGALSGFLTCSIGMPGPPLMIYFTGTKIDKAILRSTTMAYFIFNCSVSFILQLFTYSITKTVWHATLWSIPFIFLGIFLGEKLFKKLDQTLFFRVIYWLLLLTGVYLFFSTIMG
ncbi:MAG: sulfite exporter TauE/SafE family protein [Peptococcales bacterium]|jgi:uncharacterized membrane protein YfcA